MSLALRHVSLFVGRRPSRRLPWIVTALLLLLGTGTAAYAFWASTTSSNNAAAAADALTPGSKPAVAANGAAMTVTWAGGTTVNGRAATGYIVSRYSAATGGPAIAATGGCAGTISTLTCTEQNVPGGTWYYTVTPTIALWAGAESPRSNGISSDSTAPTATAAVSPTPNAAGWNNTSPVTVTVTADDGANGSGVASISYMVDGGAQQTVNAAVAPIPVSGEGTHTVSYFATDRVGNAGSPQSQTLRIDTQAPAAPGIGVPAYVNSGNVAAVTVTGTSEANAKISLTASDTGSGASHSVTVTATASSTGTWSANLDLSTFKQGTINYSATAADAAGNTGVAGTATNTKDTSAPAAAQALNVPAWVNIANASAVPVSGTAEAAGTVTVTATDAGAAHTVTGTATANGSGGWSLNLNLSSLNDGPVSYSVTVRDAAGNSGSAATAADMKDTTAPTPTVSAPEYVKASTAGSVTISGTSEAGRAVNVTVRDEILGTVSTQFTPTAATWNATLNLSSLKDGTLTYTVATTDAAGNSGTASALGPNSKDTKAPTVTGITLFNGGSTNANKPAADPGDTVTIKYSEKMDLTKICSSWTTYSPLNGTATISDTGTNDTLSFTFNGCTIGSVLLGGNYLTGADAIFGANGTASALTWDANNNSLVVKLGNAPNGSAGAGTLTLTGVPAGTPTQKPAQTQTDVAGNPIGTVSFTDTVVSTLG